MEATNTVTRGETMLVVMSIISGWRCAGISLCCVALWKSSRFIHLIFKGFPFLCSRNTTLEIRLVFSREFQGRFERGLIFELRHLGARINRTGYSGYHCRMEVALEDVAVPSSIPRTCAFTRRSPSSFSGGVKENHLP